MAIVTRQDRVSRVDTRLVRYTDRAVAAILTMACPHGGAGFRLDKVTVHYSAAVTLNVTVSLDSGEGAAWDCTLRTIALNVNQDGVWIPEEELLFSADDAITVVAPSGGAGVTGAVSVYLEEMGR